MGKFMGHDDRERNFEKALQRHLRQGAARDAGAAANSQAEPASAACPDPAMLAAFHERMLSNEEMDAAKAHIAACSRCQEILAHLEATDEVVAELDQEKVLQLREPVLAGSPSQEEEVLQHAASPAAAARPAAALKAPQSISTGRRATMWRWVAPAAAVAAGLLLWVTTRDTLQHFKKPATGIQVAQEKSERQLADRVAPLPPASSPAETRDNGRLDEALKSLNESKRSAGVLSARRAPASTLGGVVGGVGGRSEETIRELPLQSRNSALSKATPAKPAGNAASQGDVSFNAAPPSANSNAAELDKATAKDRKKADSPAAPANAPAGTAGGNITGAAGEQSARDSGRKILQKENLEPGVSAELSASSAPSPQPAAPPPAAARNAAKQSADAADKKEAGANTMTAATAQAEVTANYEHSSDLQNSKAGLAKTSEARTNSKMKDAPLILTPGGTVLWRLRAGGKIERSADRGITWLQQNSGVKLELLAGSAPSDAVCWLVGPAGTILRTTDGGGHWSKVVSPLTGDIGGIRAEDALHATIFGAGNNARFITSDGGATWTPAKE
jgi:hypothetical protein